MSAEAALAEGAAPALLQSLRAHGARGEVTCCDATGGHMLTGGGDRALRAWRWRPGAGWEPQAEALCAHRYGITAARWSPGGALAASGGVDGAARVWAGRTLAPRRLLAAGGATALCTLTWLGGARLACGHDDGAVRLWAARRGVLLARLVAHAGAVTAVAAPTSGPLLLTACTEGVLKVFDLQEVCRCAAAGEPEPAPLLWEDGAHDLGALCAAAAPNGRALATGGHDARVRLWLVSSPRTVTPGVTLEGHNAAVTALSWAGAGRLLASASLDRTARVWSPAGACLCVLHAHSRYLTCVALAPDLRYLVTGSNDKSVRTWALGDTTLDHELEPACTPLSHFGLGDLEGIGPADDSSLLALEEAGSAGSAGSEEADSEGGAARLVWRSLTSHGGAVNCISVHGGTLATACSDGLVRVWEWSGTGLALVRELGARGYPVLSVELCAGGALLLAAGLEPAAALWDVQSGCMLRLLAARGAAEQAGGGGGGGWRAGRAAPPRAAHLLLASDDGVTPLWSLADPDPAPLHVYGGHVEAATCCAWSWCARVAAAGGAGGELLLLAPPPRARTLCHQPNAHDLGVQSCDFAPASVLELAGDELLLASGGSDDCIRLWSVRLDEDEETATIELASSMLGHSGGVASVRWGAGVGGSGVLASAGADGWARVWRVARAGAGAGAQGELVLRQLAALPAHRAAGTAAAACLESGLVALGSLSGELSVWRLPPVPPEETASEDEGDGEGARAGAVAGDEEDEEDDPRWWGGGGVARWLREYVTRVPGAGVDAGREEALLARARARGVTGARLLDEPPHALLADLGYGTEGEKEEQDVEMSEEEKEARSAVRARLLEELQWLRREPPDPGLVQAACAPHGLLCPVSHGLLREPARAADGVTYDRAALHEWFLAADGAVSFVSGRRLLNPRVLPNYLCRDQLRAFLRQHDEQHQHQRQHPL